MTLIHQFRHLAQRKPVKIFFITHFVMRGKICLDKLAKFPWNKEIVLGDSSTPMCPFVVGNPSIKLFEWKNCLWHQVTKLDSCLQTGRKEIKVTRFDLAEERFGEMSDAGQSNPSRRHTVIEMNGIHRLTKSSHSQNYSYVL